jgi:hypothetical protein
MEERSDLRQESDSDKPNAENKGGSWVLALSNVIERVHLTPPCLLFFLIFFRIKRESPRSPYNKG